MPIRLAGIYRSSSIPIKLLLMLFAAGWLVFGAHIGLKAGWITAKAGVAQVLLDYAWEYSRSSRQSVKPWPWMDTFPVGRLTVERSGDSHIILQGSSGEAMAFGPALISIPGQAETDGDHKLAGLRAIGGHRDSHLQFLQHLKRGDRLVIEDVDGSNHHYAIESMQVVNVLEEELHVDTTIDGLLLVTCYPFNTLSAGGPERLVAFARRTAIHEN